MGKSGRERKVGSVQVGRSQEKKKAGGKGKKNCVFFGTVIDDCMLTTCVFSVLFIHEMITTT